MTHLPNIDSLFLVMDKLTFMSLLSCFYDTDGIVKHFCNPCITNKTNSNLNTVSKLLLKFYFNLNCLGFNYLKKLLTHFFIFGVQDCFVGDAKIFIPFCLVCISGCI